MKKIITLFILVTLGALNSELFAQVVIPPAPTITVQPPASVSYCRNVQATISFSASGFLPTYQWYIFFIGCEFCETPLTNNTTYSGVNTNTLGINTGMLTAGTYYYLCRVSNAGGQVWTDLVQVNVLNSTAPNAPGTTGASRCGTGSVTLSASGGVAGQYRWYATASGGTPIAGQTGATYTTPSLSSTTNYYVAINNGTCESNRSLVTATINTAPNAPTTTGASRCGTGTVTLTASGGVAGQYRWYTAATGGTPISGQTNSSFTTPSISSTTTYYVAINNGTCESARTAVTATVNAIPTAPTTTGASRCGTGTVTLNASGGAAGQYRWYTAATGGTPITGQTNSSFTTPSISSTTTYYVSIDNGTCESARTAVTATVNTIPTAPTTTGASRCGTGTVTLTASGGTAGQYRWYTAATGGTPITGQTNSSFTTPSISSTTTYYVAINNGNCESTRTAVTATINTLPTAPTTTGASRCGTGTVTLTASGGTAGQYRWYTVATGGTPIAGQTGATYTTSSLSSTTNYYVAIDNGTCESTRTTVTATIDPIPTTPTTTSASRCGTGTVTLSASGGVAGQYRWYTAATGGTPIAGQTGATFTTPSLSSTTNYYVAINNGTCESARTSVTATINNIPTAPTTSNASRCGAGTITLTASGGTAGQYRWYTAATGGSPITGQTNSSFTTPSISSTTTYYVAINNGNCESTRTAVTATINPIPTPPTTTGAESCPPASVTLSASGGADGQYRWYTASSGGTALSGETNSSFVTPFLSATTTYYVAINNGTCESSRTPVTATIATPGCDNEPPAIDPVTSVTAIGGIITINLVDLISDTNDNVDFSTLTIISQPSSGATATIDANFNLIINYQGIPFTGTENITIQVCDIFAACTQQVLAIEVVGDIGVYSAISPNGDNRNDIFLIEHIEKFEDTRRQKLR
jgi:hypothetical protein